MAAERLFRLKPGGRHGLCGAPRHGFAAMVQDTRAACPHCKMPMKRWATPQQGTWSGDFQFVCFNDDCPYFVSGWKWMESHYNVTASYRWRVDPTTGEAGPLPVWSAQALRGDIMQEEEIGHE